MTQESAQSAGSGAERRAAFRDRRARWAFALSNTHQLLRLILGVVSVPIALAYFSKEQYGFWLMTASIGAYVTLAQLGLASSVTNAVAGARGREDSGTVVRTVSGAFFLLAAISASLVAAAMLGLPLLPVDDLFSLRGTIPEVRAILMTIVAVGAFDLVFSPLLAAQRGYQEEFRANIWQIGNGIAAFAALLAVVIAQGSLFHLALCVAIAAVVSNAGSVLTFLRRHPEAVPRIAQVEVGAQKSLLKQGLLFWGMHLCTLLVLYTDNLVIAALRGASEVIVFGLAMQLTIVSLALIHSMSAAHWGGYAEAAARGDWKWFNAAFERVLLLSTWFAGAAGVCLFAWGQELFLIWIGPDHAVPQGMLLAFALFILVNIWYSAHSVVLNSLGQLRAQLPIAGVEGALHVAAAILLARCCGATSVAWALIIPATLVSSWSLPILVKRAGVRLVHPALLLRAVVFPVLAASGTAWGLATSLPQAVGIRLTIGVAGTLLVYGGVSMLLLGEQRRRFLPWAVRRSDSAQLPG